MLHNPKETLWRSIGKPSPVNIELLKYLVGGVVYIHSKGVIHMYLSTKGIYVMEKHAKLVARIDRFGYTPMASDVAMTCLSKHEESRKWRAPEHADLVNDF